VPVFGLVTNVDFRCSSLVTLGPLVAIPCFRGVLHLAFKYFLVSFLSWTLRTGSPDVSQRPPPKRRCLLYLTTLLFPPSFLREFLIFSPTGTNRSSIPISDPVPFQVFPLDMEDFFSGFFSFELFSRHLSGHP